MVLLRLNLLLVSAAICLLGRTTQAFAGGSIHNHLTFDLMPLAISPNVPIGSGFGFSYDRYHDELKSSYTLSAQTIFPFYTQNTRMDMIVSAGLFTSITPAFSIGARIGYVVNALQSTGTGSIALRLPALKPEEKDFFSFFFEELDLGVSGAGSQYANIQFAMMLF